MSNALSGWWAEFFQPGTFAASLAEASETGAATTDPSPAGEQFLMILMGVGLLAFLPWMGTCLIRPRKLLLDDAPGRPNTLNPVSFLFVFFGWSLMVLLFAHGSSYLLGLDKSHATLLGTLLGQCVGIAMALLVAHFQFRFGIRNGLGLRLRHWKFDLIRGGAGFLIIFPVCLGLSILMSHIVPIDQQETHPLLSALATMTWPWKLCIIAAAVILAPLLEEILFRGLLQSMLRRFVTPKYTVLLSAALFAMVHFAAEPQAVPALFVLGLALGYSYERSGRLWRPILLHALFNAVMITAYLL